MEAILDTLVQFAVTAGGKLLLAIIILVIGVKLIRWLVKHGYSEEDIAKVMGGNVIRVMKETW